MSVILLAVDRHNARNSLDIVHRVRRVYQFRNKHPRYVEML
jgi:hypothetical protein